ncbi:Endonuclease, Uma2 family (restriction endonuclease fold) [Catalinimonas alkaloidigena]|uniref:Endonuclease, Uma2 family (Restriction endonuclease fold) n=1 Tax=Catalinimonas alkaloidigena TaxID=1075417 RepID=A0A1G9V0D6_9BACT|nr:Uma2 family endonuclease [Catalinimonas alkaloidigena]SDM65365.1 Endonuclease, Uma2 family (restriction endonuclease fold) [Catalinimonas alkaloidigena]
MAQVLTKPRPITVEEFRRMVEANVFPADERLELLEGQLFPMSPINPGHATSVRRLIRFFSEHYLDRFLVDAQNPLLLGPHALPQPDLSLLQLSYQLEDHRLPSAEDALLVIEVSDHTLTKDRRQKLPLYAKAGVPETWIVNLKQNQIEVYAHPRQGTYQDQQVYRQGQTVVSATLEGLQVPVDQILTFP